MTCYAQLNEKKRNKQGKERYGKQKKDAKKFNKRGSTKGKKRKTFLLIMF